MATRKQAVEILEKIKQIRPVTFFHKVDDIHVGTKFVLVYLSENQKETYASSLCEVMGISRARMSVILDKLIQKGLVQKIVSLEDARKEVISITPLGLNLVESDKRKVEDDVINVIDNIGYEKLNEVIDVLEQIKNIIKA